MKRPKMPDLRIPKKYRDGKVLTAVMVALETACDEALAIKEVPDRFDALARLQKKIISQRNYVWNRVYSRQGKQDVALVVGGFGGGFGVYILGMALVAPPLALAAIPMAAAPVLTAIYNPLAYKRNKKKETHPLARIDQLGALWCEVNAHLLSTAMDDPLALVEKPRFKELCGNSDKLRDALSEAIIKSRNEKLAAHSTSAPDLTAALSKPRLP